MVKFFVGIAIVAFTTYCGIFLSRKYKQRKTFFEEFYRFHFCVIEELNFTKRAYEDFYKKQKYCGEFEMVLMAELERRKVRKALPISLDEYLFLTHEEKSFIAEYLATIGAGDSYSQKAYFTRAENRLQSLKTKAIEDCKKYVDLYIKMGFLFGLAILIVLI